MSESYFDLTNENAGVLVGWLGQRGIPAVMRGGPKGGSIGATVIVNQRGKLVIEPGDRVRVIGWRGGALVIAEPKPPATPSRELDADALIAEADRIIAPCICDCHALAEEQPWNPDYESAYRPYQRRTRPGDPPEDNYPEMGSE